MRATVDRAARPTSAAYMPQPQLGAASQPQLASQPHAGAQQACFMARRALMRAKMQPHLGAQHESQHEASQPQLGSAQPQAGSAAQPHDGSQPQLASQPQVGSQQHECLAAIRARRRANRPHFGAQHESQHESQAISQPQLGSASQPQLGSAQPQLGSQPQPPRPKNALAFEAKASAMATTSIGSR
jgi:hypothetical protein